MDDIRTQESGFVLVVSVVLLVILSLLGVFGARMAITEYQITGHELVYTESFYRSESLAMSMAQKIENEDKLNLAEGKIDANNDNTSTEDSGLLPSGEIVSYDPSSLTNIDGYLTTHGYKVAGDEKTKFLAVDVGVDDDASLGMGGSQVHKFDVYGRSEENRTSKTVKIGLKRRY